MDKKREIDVVEGVPNWAVCGLVNGDWTGTDDEDENMAKSWEKELNDNGWILMSPIDGTESDFNPFPAFGLPCDTVDFNIMREI